MATIQKMFDANTTGEKVLEHLTDPKRLRLGKRNAEEGTGMRLICPRSPWRMQRCVVVRMRGNTRAA